MPPARPPCEPVFPVAAVDHVNPPSRMQRTRFVTTTETDIFAPRLLQCVVDVGRHTRRRQVAFHRKARWSSKGALGTSRRSTVASCLLLAASSIPYRRR